jgi:hypothetical protein
MLSPIILSATPLSFSPVLLLSLISHHFYLFTLSCSSPFLLSHISFFLLYIILFSFIYFAPCLFYPILFFSLHFVLSLSFLLCLLYFSYTSSASSVHARPHSLNPNIVFRGITSNHKINSETPLCIHITSVSFA